MKTLEKVIQLKPVLPSSKPRTTLPRSKTTQSRYVINENEVLGEGGMGMVYRGFDTDLGRNVAIKRLHPKKSPNAAPSDTLNDEAQLLASLNHPNIVTVYDVYQDKGGVCIVMELLEGDTLDKLVKTSRFEMDAFSDLVLQTQDALLTANETGILHGDLKPQNIIQTNFGSGRKQYKLLDFDQARLIARDTCDRQQSTYGSIHFMAPERFEGSSPTRTSDIYAMGCVYYYVLTGTFPCQGNNSVEVMASHLRNDITPLCELRPDLPEWLSQWIGWLLSREPKDRPQSSLAVSMSFKELLQRFNTVPKKVIGSMPQPNLNHDDAWYVSRENQVGGPHTWETVQKFLRSGALTTNDLIKSNLMPQWVNIATLTESHFENAG